MRACIRISLSTLTNSEISSAVFIGWSMWQDFEGSRILRCSKISRKFGKYYITSFYTSLCNKYVPRWNTWVNVTQKSANFRVLPLMIKLMLRYCQTVVIKSFRLEKKKTNLYSRHIANNCFSEWSLTSSHCMIISAQSSWYQPLLLYYWKTRRTWPRNETRHMTWKWVFQATIH